MYGHHFIFIVFTIIFIILCSSRVSSKECECKPKNQLFTCDCKTIYYNNNTVAEKAHMLLVSSLPFAIPRDGNIHINMIEFIQINDVNITILNSIESEIKMENLTHFTLNNCEIREINKIAFNNTRYITHLNIENNLISTLSEDTFIFVKKLHYLNLNNNSIEDIPENIFKKLSNLTEIHLRLNNIKYLPENLFTSLNNLSYIHLDNNKIKAVPPSLFSNNKKLGKIFLNNNNIRELSKDVFQGLTNVYEIYLEHNHIAIVPNGLIENLSKLQSIQLEHNKIQIINSKAFMNNPKLKAVFINNNHIKNVHPNIITTSPKLKYLNVTNNEIICDCKLKQFFSAYKNSNLTINIECSQPKEMIHKNFSHLSLNDFICPPKILTCTSRKLGNVTNISCKIYGDPTPKYIWIYQEKQIKNNTYFTVSYGDIDENHFWANLTISNITSNTKGKYTLNVRNEGGNDLYIYCVLFEEDTEICIAVLVISSVLVFLAFIICVVVCVVKRRKAKLNTVDGVQMALINKQQDNKCTHCKEEEDDYEDDSTKFVVCIIENETADISIKNEQKNKDIDSSEGDLKNQNVSLATGLGQHTTSLCSTANSEQEIISSSTTQSAINSGSLSCSVHSQSSYATHSSVHQRAQISSNMSRLTESSNFLSIK